LKKTLFRFFTLTAKRYGYCHPWRLSPSHGNPTVQLGDGQLHSEQRDLLRQSPEPYLRPHESLWRFTSGQSWKSI